MKSSFFLPTRTTTLAKQYHCHQNKPSIMVAAKASGGDVHRSNTADSDKMPINNTSTGISA